MTRGVLSLLVFISALALSNAATIQTLPENGKLEIGPNDEELTKTLTCNATESQSQSFRWYKWDGEKEISVENDTAITVNGGSLTVETISLKDGEVFRCRLDAQTFGEFEIVDTRNGQLFKVENFKKSYGVLMNHNLDLNCNVLNRTSQAYEFDKIYIRWFMWDKIDDTEFEKNGSCTNVNPRWLPISTSGLDSEGPRYELREFEKLPNEILKIVEAESDHRRGYKCVATLFGPNKDILSCAESETFVRVKDKFGALWPFLGIVIEVLVLCIIILITERRRAKKEDAMDAEEDEDAAAVDKGANIGDNKNEVRQRKQ